ncbi:MAG: hypothetical protein OEV64_12525, partial [Desulfobulbaceae bacterium]|nr:hypothetical protein [Desulfobulbaceae bacterium]
MAIKQQFKKMIPGATLLLLGLVFFLLPGSLTARQQRTLFVPLKINAVAPTTLEKFTDNLLNNIEEADLFVILSREEARKYFDYGSVWPPRQNALARLANEMDGAYVVFGAITRLGEHYSLDLFVYDQLTGKSAHS